MADLQSNSINPAPHLKSLVDAMERTPEGTGYTLPPGLVEALRAIKAEKWSNNRIVHTALSLDTDKSIFLCREGLMEWWWPFHSKVLSGQLEDMQKIYEAFQEDGKTGITLNSAMLNSAMTWGAYPHEVAPGIKNVQSTECMEQLFKWGADPNHDNGDWFAKVTKEGSPAMTKLFVQHGARHDLILKLTQDAYNNNNAKSLENIREATRGIALRILADPETLVETKNIDAEGDRLKTIFNFGSRRVSEVYEWNKMKQVVVKDFSFDDYDQEALQSARGVLAGLGGTPSPLKTQLDKQSFPLARGKNS